MKCVKRLKELTKSIPNFQIWSEISNKVNKVKFDYNLKYII